MSGSSKRSIVRIIGSLVAVLLLIYWLNKQGWGEILAAIGSVPLGLCLLILCIALLSRITVALRWYVLLHSVNSGISYGQTLRLTFAGLFASNFLPTTIGGDVVRLAGGLQLQIDGAVCAASLIADRLIGMAGMATILPVGLIHLWQAAILGSTLSSFDSHLLASLSVGVSTTWMTTLWERVKHFVQRIFQVLSLWLRNPRALFGALLCTWTHMLFLFLAVWFLLASMGEDMPFWLVGGLWSVVYFVTLLPISINGLGIQEVALTFFFSNVGGISVRGALTLAILIRTLMMLASLPGVIFLPMILSTARRYSPIDLNPLRSSFGMPSGSKKLFDEPS